MDSEELYAKMYLMNEYEIVREMASFKESIFLLNLNYAELSKHFENFRRTVLQILSEEHPYKNIDIETKRLIHNYLSSAVSLIDHTRIYVKKLHNFIDLNEYQLKIKKTFIESSICIFVKDLRQYLQHFKLPEISYQKNMLSIKHHALMLISKQELLKFSGWTKKSKEYIENHIGSIDLRVVLKEYQSIIIEFYNWLIDWQEDIFKEDIKIVQDFKLSVVQTQLKTVLRKIIYSQYKNYAELERDLYPTLPEKIKRIRKFNDAEKLNEIFNLFETDNLTKFLLVKNLKIILNN